MAEYDTRVLYALTGGLLLGAAAYSAKWISGADPLVFAAAPACSVLGYFLLQSWRNGVGRTRIEPLVQYIVIVALSWALLGWLFAHSAWISQEATLLALALILPAALDWLIERTTLKSLAPEPEAPTLGEEA